MFSHNNKNSLFLILFIFVQLVLLECNFGERYQNLRYHKVRTCFKSKLSIISWRNVNNLTECMNLARSKNGFAFNFSPSEAKALIKSHVKNCQILDCPEKDNSTTLILDPVFDYYTAFGNLSLIENATCLRNVGLFTVAKDKQNYTSSIVRCQSLGGDLANILSESRTNFLSQLIKTTLPDWYRAAYVGLDDMEFENSFKSPYDKDIGISCTKFRAWAPGHPRNVNGKEDCVILDEEKMWRTSNCSKNLSAICELFPMKPLRVFGIRNVTLCANKSRKERRKCKENKKLFEIYMNSSRLDQCALMNADL